MAGLDDIAAAIDALAWEKYRTVVVYGKVSRAVWVRASADWQRPGVRFAPGPEEAREMLDEDSILSDAERPA